MACKFEKLLTDHFFGELEGSSRAGLEAHLGGCPTCPGILKSLGGIAAAALPPSFPSLQNEDWQRIRLGALNAAQTSISQSLHLRLSASLHLTISNFLSYMAPASSALAAAALVLSLSRLAAIPGASDLRPAPLGLSTGTDAPSVIARGPQKRNPGGTAPEKPSLAQDPSVERASLTAPREDATGPSSSPSQSEVAGIEPVGTGVLPASGNKAPSSLDSPSKDSAMSRSASFSEQAPLAGTGHAPEKAPVLVLRHNRINPGTGEKVAVTVNLPQSGRLLVRIFGQDGALIATLADAETPAGDAEFTWAGQNSQGQTVASGIYFVAVDAPGVQARDKILVVK